MQTHTPDPPATNTDISSVPIATIEQWSGQWRRLYETRRKLHDVSPMRIIVGQLLAVAVATLAGLALSQNREALLLVGTSLILYPALADLLSSNAAVLTASLHHDIDNIPERKWLVVISAYIKSVIVAVLASGVLGVLSGLLGIIFFEAQLSAAITLAVVAGGVAALAGFPIMLGAMFYARARGINPDDISGPTESTVFTALTLIAIITASQYIQ